MINTKKLIKQQGLISNMMNKYEITGVLDHLRVVLDNDIPGAVVELGCNVGTTSVFIQKYLDLYGSDKQFHVYDSWQGLPEKTKSDKSKTKKHFFEGQCKTTKEKFTKSFRLKNLKLPIIHSGWFKDIPDEEYPDQICFAFLDGDFYTSIMDSLNKIFHKMQKGGIIIIDDCGWDVLPGVQKACNDFLYDKKEVLHLTGYPNLWYTYGQPFCGGKIIKK